MADFDIDLLRGANDPDKPSPRTVKIGDAHQILDREISPTNGIILDSDWAKKTFNIVGDSLNNDALRRQNRFRSSADFKFNNSSLGGSVAINSKPQFTPYSDIRSVGTFAGANNISSTSEIDDTGIGRLYSEIYDDGSDVLSLRFGVPQFKSLGGFLIDFSDSELTSLASTGQGKSLFYKAATIAGQITFALAFPVATLLLITGRVIKWAFVRTSSKFYSLKPTMPLYWSTVSTIVNTIMINRGVMPKVLHSDPKQSVNDTYKIDQPMLDNLSRMMPGIFNSNNGVDVAAVANRTQARSNFILERSWNKLNQDNESIYEDYLNNEPLRIKAEKPENLSLFDVLSKYLGKSYYEKPEGVFTGDDARDFKDVIDADVNSFSTLFDAEYQQGSSFASFKVDQVKSVTDTFNNAVKNNGIADAYNAASGTARDVKFNLAGGNLGDGVIIDSIETVLKAATDVALGAINGATMGVAGGLIDLIQGARMEVPKMWDTSDVEIGTTEFKMRLSGWVNNPISQLKGIYMPLAMLLAGTSPLKGGKQSHVSPFVCQAFLPGKVQIDLGMIESLTIERGVSNLSHDKKGLALALDVTFNIVDLAPIMSVPLSTGSILGGDILDEDSKLHEYLAVVSAMSIREQIYGIPRAKIKLARRLRALDRLTSAASWAMLTHDALETGFFTSGISGLASKLSDEAVAAQ